MRCHSRSPDDTRRAGAALGETLVLEATEGAAIALVGALGAGKTEFVRGLAAGAGADPQLVASPTFVVATEYPATEGRRVAHVDCYRVESEAELEAAGFLDLLVPEVIVAVEWADRFSAALPSDHLVVQISRIPGEGAEQRELVGQPRGPASTRWCREWEARLAASRAAL